MMMLIRLEYEKGLSCENISTGKTIDPIHFRVVYTESFCYNTFDIKRIAFLIARNESYV